MSMHDIKVLLVDDQRNHLQMMKRMFECNGCETVTVDSGEEAKFILDWASDFDAIVTDLKMPWLDGIELCKDTKRQYPTIQIYALSGNLKLYSPEILSYAGFDGVFQKPVTFELINEMLNAIKAKNEQP